MPIGELAPRSGARRGLVLIVGLSWLVGSAGAALWILQQQSGPAAASPAVATQPAGVAPGAPKATPGPRPRAEPRALTEDEAMRQVEAAEDRTVQAQLEEQRARRQAQDLTRERMQAAEAARDAERKAEIAAQLEQQARGAAQRGVQIIMYTTRWCGACKVARRYFNEHEVRYEERDIEVKAEWREQCRVLNPQLSVPTIRVGDQMMVGFGAAAFEHLYEQARH